MGVTIVIQLLQTSLVYGYNCGRGKCDLAETGKQSNLGWFGRQVDFTLYYD